MPQPLDASHWVRGQTSLAIGKFEGYLYFEVTGGLDQYLILSSVTGAWSNNENLELATSDGGPWTDAEINTATPVEQVEVDCDTGCFGDECDPNVEPPIIVPADSDDDTTKANEDMAQIGGVEGDEWTGIWSYLTTLPGGSSLPFESGSVTGVNTNAIGELRQWIDPGAGMGNIRIEVFGVALGSGGRRFTHGEVLDHGQSTAQVTLANPMEQLEIIVA